jgi:hypothetical protein
MATYLYISETLVDLYDDGSIPLVQSIADISNISGGSTKGSYSVPFTVPATKANKQLFDFPELVAVNSFDGSTELNARLEVDGTMILDGRARINEVVMGGAVVDYKIILFDNNSNWINAIKGKKLTELDFSEYDHVWNKANINASEYVFDESFYLYPLVNYGTPIGGIGKWVVEDRLPWLRVWKIFRKIFEDAGYTISSDFINGTGNATDFFKKLFMSPKNAPELTDDEVNANKFRVSVESVNEAQRMLLPSFYKNIPFDNDVNNGNNVYFNTEDSEFTLGVGGKYVSGITAKMAFDLTIELNKARITGFKSAESEVSIRMYVNGVVKKSKTFTFEKITFPNTDIQFIGNWRTGSLTINEGDIVEFKAASITSDSPSKTIHQIKFGTKLSNNVFKSIAKGMTTTISSIMPDHQQLDFISDCKELFNLYFYTDEIHRIVRIEPRDEFYNQTAIDWSSKLDKSKPITMGHLGDNMNKTVRFRYKEDSKDEHAANKAIDVYGGDPIGSYETTITNVNARDGVQDKTLKIFSSTWVSRGLIGCPSALIPVMWKTEERKMPVSRTTDFNTRILHYNGLAQLANGETWKFESDTRTTFPQLTMEIDGIANENSLHFDDSPFTSGLYQKHWRNSIETINEGRVYNMTLRLNAVDIQSLDFRVPVYIEDAGNGNYFHIKKLEYDANNMGLVKAEMLLVVNPVPKIDLTEDKKETIYKFVPPLIVNDDQYITTIIDSVEVDVYGDTMAMSGDTVISTGGTNKIKYDG